MSGGAVAGIIEDIVRGKMRDTVGATLNFIGGYKRRGRGGNGGAAGHSNRVQRGVHWEVQQGVAAGQVAEQTALWLDWHWGH